MNDLVHVKARNYINHHVKKINESSLLLAFFFQDLYEKLKLFM
jgi:hypothetical protein